MTLTLTIRNTDSLQPGMRRELVLSRRGGIIGRANVNDWWLPDHRKIISSDHSRIEYADGIYCLHDISLNGTFLNGNRTRMSAPRQIEPRDQFRIGEYVIVASLSGESEAIYEQEQERRRSDSSERDVWEQPKIDIQDGALADVWDSDDDDNANDQPDSELAVDDDVWPPEPPAPQPTPRPSPRPIWGDEDNEPGGASPHSSEGPDLVGDPSADDIWGRLENDQRIDLHRARIGLEIEEDRDPFADFYEKDSESVLLDDPRKAPPSAHRPSAAHRGDAGSGRADMAQSSVPVYDDDTWDDVDNDGMIEENVVSPVRRQPPPGRTSPPPRRHDGFPAAPSGTPQSSGDQDLHMEGRGHTQARGPHNTAELDHLARAFLIATGVDPHRIKDPSPAMIDKSGQMLGKLVAGLFVLLEARSRAKAELGAQKTAFPVDGTNPLKFNTSPEDALVALINPPEPGFMNAGKAIDEAFFDLQAHQEATVMAMRGALRASLDKFSPKAIRKTVGEKGFLKKFLPGTGEAELWRAYERAFSGVVKDSDEAFLEAFALEFKAAYEKAGRR